MSECPVIFLAFANSHPPFLETLKDEEKGIRKELFEADNAGRIKVYPHFNVSRQDMAEVFTSRFRNRVAIFHFAGHADSEMLALDDALADANNLADLLAAQESLKLVFLNGCATKRQVTRLHKAGVAAVIATHSSINDQRATLFAIQFYRSLAGGASIGEAFEETCAYTALHWNGQTVATRYMRPKWDSESDTDPLPWGLYLNNDNSQILQWKLPPPLPTSEIPRKGVLLHSIPAKMQVSNAHRCIVRIAINRNIIKQNLPKTTQHIVLREDVRLSDDMEVTFIESRYFDIQALNTAMQYVGSDDYTEWLFDVRPLEQGRFPLSFKVAMLIDTEGKRRREIVLTESVMIVSEAVEAGMEFKVSALEMPEEKEENISVSLKNNSQLETQIRQLEDAMAIATDDGISDSINVTPQVFSRQLLQLIDRQGAQSIPVVLEAIKQSGYRYDKATFFQLWKLAFTPNKLSLSQLISQIQAFIRTLD
jgi:hypothetical protein